MSRVPLTFDPRPPIDSPSEGAANRLLTGGAWLKAEQAEENDPADALLDFKSERPAEPPDYEPPDYGGRPAPWVPEPLPATPEPRHIGRTPRIVALGLLGLVVATGTLIYYVARPDPSEEAAPATTIAAPEGRALIASNPAGALVFVDGAARGATPLDLLLPVGVHTLQLQHGAAIRTLPLEILSSQVSSQYIELPAVSDVPLALAPAPTSSPDRPATPARSAPAQSAARVSTAPRPAPRPVQSSAAARAGSPPTPAPVAEGWVSIGLPFPVQVTESGRSLGTIAGGPLKLPAGLHTLELANATYEFRTTLAVNVAAGRTTATPVTLPNGLLSVNALPWAEVFVDGRLIGMTPLANVPVPIGSHELVWRHPELGERRQTVSVTARSPVRRGMDFRR